MRFLVDNLKNAPGWRSPEQLVIFSVDDYGSVCLNSAAAKRKLLESGVTLAKHIERLDALETRQDLEALFETLASVTDANGRHAVFTANALCANPEFSQLVAADGCYQFLTLPETFEAQAAEQPGAYYRAWELWREGAAAGYLKPQFHGREHLNIEMLERKVCAGDAATLANITNRSLAGIAGDPDMPGVRFTEAFSLSDRSQLERHREIIRHGLDLFASVFGTRSETFVPPGMALHPDLYETLEVNGIKGIDKPQRAVRRVRSEKVASEWNRLGRKKGQNHVTIVRNVVFEPTKNTSVDSVGLALRQIETAFRWGKPAIISSHRVNFAGHIVADNRKRGLQALASLLEGIVTRWPTAQFISADELVEKVLAKP